MKLTSNQIKYSFLSALAIVAMLLDVGFIPIHLTLAVILAWVLVHDEGQGLLAAAGFGLVFDMLSLDQMGTHSLIFLVYAFILIAIRRVRLFANTVSTCFIYPLLVFLTADSVTYLLRYHTLPQQVLMNLPTIAADAIGWGIIMTVFIIVIGPRQYEALRLKMQR